MMVTRLSTGLRRPDFHDVSTPKTASARPDGGGGGGGGEIVIGQAR
jgi:hypothetical protein